jgi:hypothetical protein
VSGTILGQANDRAWRTGDTMSDTMSKMNAFTDSIIDGKWDDALQSLEDAIKSRHSILRNQDAAKNVLSIKVGDEVTLKGLSPKYLNGALVTVIEKRNDKFRVQIPISTSMRKWSGSTPTVPAACLEVS